MERAPEAMSQEPTQPASGVWHYYHSPDVGWVVCDCLPGDETGNRIYVAIESSAEWLVHYLNAQAERADALEEAVREVRRVAIEGVFKGGYALDDTERLEKVIEITDALSTQNRREA